MAMSDHAPDPGHDHQPAPRETSSTVLWLVGLLAIVATVGWTFFHFFAEGRREARGMIKLRAPSAAAGEPDHAALSADRSAPVLEIGQSLYLKNCASCHGANGVPTMLGARNLKAEAMKNPLGAGPYGLYMVTQKGYGSMSAIGNLAPDERYAIVHYIHSAFLKSGPSFVDEDSAAVKAQIPAKGGGGPKVAIPPPPDPASVVPPAVLFPLMAGQAAEVERQQQALTAWLAAIPVPGAELHGPDQALRQLIAAHPAQGQSLQQACTADNRPGFDRVALGSPVLATLPVVTLDSLYVHYRSASRAEVSP